VTNETKEIVEKPKKEKKQKKGYFDNAIMLELMKERNALEISLAIQHDTLEENRLRKIEEKIGALYIEVAHGMLRRPNFINYPQDQKDDMISDALFCMTKAGAKYDTNYPNPFGYLSQITFHAFIQSIKNMKKRTGLFVSIEHIENLNETGDYSE
jgi:hypothetical protein